LYFEDDAPEWNYDAKPRLALEYWIRLFRHPTILLGRFSPDQIGYGISHLINGSCSDYAHLLRNLSVPGDLRVDAILAIADLYRKAFA